MARIRTIKPEFWLDEDLAEVSAEAVLLAIGLLNQADDEGYFKANPKLIQAAIFPLRELSQNIHGILNELSNIGYITLKTGSDGKEYGLVTNFSKHQKINRPSASKIKALMEFSEDSVSPHPRKGKEQGKEQGERRISPKRFKPPSVSEVIDHLEKKNVPNPKPLAESFVNFYESKGWVVGKTKMKSWVHAIGGNNWIPEHLAKQKSEPLPRSMRGAHG